MSTSGSVSCLLFASVLALDCQASNLPEDPAHIDPGAKRYVLWVQLCAPDLDASDLKGIEHEASSLYSGAGVELAWVERCDGRPIESIHPNSARVYVVERMPRVLLRRFPRHLRVDRMMGFTWTDAGEKPGAAIYVSREAVVANASDFRSKPLSRSLRSRAIGRVVAHELAHRFIQKTHTGRGILKANFNYRDLTCRDTRSLFFSEKQARHLRSLAATGKTAVAALEDFVSRAGSREAPAR